MIYKLFDIKNKIPKFIRNLIPRFISRKINKKFFYFYFIPTFYKNLPKVNYINNNNLKYQEKLIYQFNNNYCQNSLTTCPHLIQLLLMKYNNKDEFSFLDVGGDNIDFFLELRMKFKNVKYYTHNLENVNNIFKSIKLKYGYKNIFVIEKIKDVFSKKFDFINFGSSIEYFDNYEYVLKNIVNISKTIFFSATTLYESNNRKYKNHIIVKQVNMYPDINYLYFFNKNNFYNFFLKKGYKLVFERKNLTDKVNYKNFNKLFDKISYLDFLFEKK